VSRTSERANEDPDPGVTSRSGDTGVRRRELAIRIDVTEGFFVYILASRRNGTLYVGVTNDLSRRIADHKAKLVPGFTRKYGVDRLVHVDAFSSILEARSYERELKRWKRSWKLDLIEKNNPTWRDLSEDWLV